MNFGKDFSFEEGMSEMVEGGAALAWRLLATLEGGSLLLVASMYLAYTVRNKIVQQCHTGRRLRKVLVTNTTNSLGRELKTRLESYGCIVNNTNQRIADVSNGVSSEDSKLDAIIVVGAEPKADGLDGMASLVTEDVYDNLRLLESLSPLVHQGGYIAWACSHEGGPPTGAFRNASASFDTVLQASLQHLATLHNCKPIWVGRCASPELAAEQTIAAILSGTTQATTRYSARMAAQRVGKYLGRWLKIIS